MRIMFFSEQWPSSYMAESTTPIQCRSGAICEGKYDHLVFKRWMGLATKYQEPESLLPDKESSELFEMRQIRLLHNSPISGVFSTTKKSVSGCFALYKMFLPDGLFWNADLCASKCWQMWHSYQNRKFNFTVFIVCGGLTWNVRRRWTVRSAVRAVQ